MIWDKDLLLAKSRTFFARAYDHPPEDPQFGFWISLGLEMLARAALAQIHPVLLADPQDGKNLLFAFGVHTKNPKSIPTKTVLDRCLKLVPGFTVGMQDACGVVSEMRNEELHAATVPFASVPTSSWLPGVLASCRVLGLHLGLDLVALVGAEEAAAADEMLAEIDGAIRAEVNQAIVASKKAVESLTDEDRASRRTATPEDADSWGFDERTCPACGDLGWVRGKVLRELEPRIEDGDVVLHTVYLPSRFRCGVCGLRLRGQERLRVAGIADSFTKTSRESAEEYYGARFMDSMEYDDYGND